MKIFKDKDHRDDLYALNRSGVRVTRTTIEGKRMGTPDRAHLFESDEDGRLVPSTLLRAKHGRSVTKFSSLTLRLGAPHSHDILHKAHYLEAIHKPARDLLTKFRTAVKQYRRSRQEKRDR